MLDARCSRACLVLLLLLQLAVTPQAVIRSSVRASAPVSRPSAPVSASSTFRPTSVGGIGGASRFSRPGFRSSSFVLPFAAGALAGASLASLNSNRNAYCNGVSIQCYRDTCQQGLASCSATNSTSLVQGPCPDPQYSECWQSSDELYQCFGRRRPSFSGEDVVAVCNSPDGVNASNSLKVPLVLMAIPTLLALLAL
eukprot:GHRR01003953.1.p1 GENE.GHRR01003953.1~~GHRR01003953.1.p1  ORF type:complete len:197 (+),score=55.56 GHRR01003953.1:155-745(+)